MSVYRAAADSPKLTLSMHIIAQWVTQLGLSFQAALIFCYDWWLRRSLTLLQGILHLLLEYLGMATLEDGILCRGIYWFHLSWQKMAEDIYLGNSFKHWNSSNPLDLHIFPPSAAYLSVPQCFWAYFGSGEEKQENIWWSWKTRLTTNPAIVENQTTAFVPALFSPYLN